MIKICIKCDKEKDESEFSICNKKTGQRRTECQDCNRERGRVYYAANKEKAAAQYRKRYANPEIKAQIQARNKIWRDTNPDKTEAQWRRYQSENRAVVNAKARQWRVENREKHLKYQREYAANKRKTDISYKIAHRLRSRILTALKDGYKSAATEELIGCTVDQFMSHLKARFSEGMTWEKLNAGEIHIDHIIPCCAFDLSDPEQQYKCFHYSNMQPLWAKDNLSKISQDIKQSRNKNL